MRMRQVTMSENICVRQHRDSSIESNIFDGGCVFIQDSSLSIEVVILFCHLHVVNWQVMLQQHMYR